MPVCSAKGFISTALKWPDWLRFKASKTLRSKSDRGEPELWWQSNPSLNGIFCVPKVEEIFAAKCSSKEARIFRLTSCHVTSKIIQVTVGFGWNRSCSGHSLRHSLRSRLRQGTEHVAEIGVVAIATLIGGILGLFGCEALFHTKTISKYPKP